MMLVKINQLNYKPNSLFVSREKLLSGDINTTSYNFFVIYICSVT